jgi:hypothetical protein
MAGHGVGSRIATSLDGEYPDLDWALIEIHQPHSQPANIITIDKPAQHPLCVERIVPVISKNEPVLVVTSSGLQRAVLSASSTFLKSGYGCSFEEVFTVRLDGILSEYLSVLYSIYSRYSSKQTEGIRAPGSSTHVMAIFTAT